MTKAQQALEFAREEQRKSGEWQHIHNALFGIGGRLGKLFPTEAERVEFAKSPEYHEIQLLMGPMKLEKLPVVEPSGKFLLRIPKSLHSALIQEAEEEGVSLNQLCLTKLSVQLKLAVA